MKTAKLQEKIIQVPQNLVEQIAQDIFPYFMGLLVYNLQMATPLVRNTNPSMVDEAEKGRDRLLSFYKISLREADSMALRISKNPDPIVSKEYDLTQFSSPYGDFADFQPKVNIHLRSTPYRGLMGRHSSKTKDVTIFTQILMSSLYISDFEKELEMKDIKFLTDIGLPANKETCEMFINFSELFQVLKKVNSKLRTTIEHELIHLIQDTFFAGKYKDKDYYKRDMFSYSQSPVEENPLLLDELEGLKNQYPHVVSLGITKEEFEEFTSGMLRFWYKSPLKKKKELISNFYHLVQDRIGFRR